MAYGQTGTGKTFTLGKLGDEDVADRGIMVRALEDILANVNHVDDTVTVSYLQVQINSVVMFRYYETVRFLFLNVPIIEPKCKC
jgi:hypothetical protein